MDKNEGSPNLVQSDPNIQTTLEHGLLPNHFQKNKIGYVLNDQTGAIFKMKKTGLNENLFNYFNSLSKFDIQQYNEYFDVDLTEDKSFNLRYKTFGSSVCISDSNFIFSIGGIPKRKLMAFLRRESFEGNRSI